MIRLIVTADDRLYDRLAEGTQSEGDKPQRATNVLDGLRQAMALKVGTIVVDMALHAADTLIETLRSRPLTSEIPLFAVESNGRLPLEIRRLCTGVLEVDAL